MLMQRHTGDFTAFTVCADTDGPLERTPLSTSTERHSVMSNQVATSGFLFHDTHECTNEITMQGIGSV